MENWPYPNVSHVLYTIDENCGARTVWANLRDAEIVEFRGYILRMLIGSFISAGSLETRFWRRGQLPCACQLSLKILNDVQCAKGNRNLSFGRYDVLKTALGPGPRAGHKPS